MQLASAESQVGPNPQGFPVIYDFPQIPVEWLCILFRATSGAYYSYG